MIIRNLTPSGDWTFGQGRENYLRAEAAIELNLVTRVKCFLNDCFWAMDFGIDWWNLLGTNNPTATSNIVLQVRAMIAASFGVVRIISVSATTDRATRRLTTTWVVDTIYSRNVRGTAQP